MDSRAAGLVVAAILIAAGASLAFFYSQGLTNIYGDALAHMQAARRFTDSLTPGLPEIGSVWLPLHHLLAAPLATNDHLWRTGLAGSIVSVAAFCGAAWFIFRLALEMSASIAAGVIALAAFVICPNMLYTSATPLTEPLAIFWAVLAVYALFRYHLSGRMPWVVGAGLAAFGGCLTRYDEWYVLPFAALFILLVRSELGWEKRLRRAVIFFIIAGAAPALWMLHDAYRYGNPVQFINGPASARAIYAHQLATTAFGYPTAGSFWTSAHYYLEDMKLVIGPWTLELAALGLVVWIVDRRLMRRRAAALLLLVPLPFYIQALAGGTVPIYVPALFPYSYYNLRYGLELLPAVAILASFLITPELPRKIRAGLMTMCVIIFAAQGAAMFTKGARQLPVVREGIINTPCKVGTDRALIDFFRSHYDGGRILMISGRWPCVLPTLGIPYRNTIGTENMPYWKRLPHQADSMVEWIVRGQGGPVDHLMTAYPAAFKDFKPVLYRFEPRQNSVTVYRLEKVTSDK